MNNYITINNNQTIDFGLIPVLEYSAFLDINTTFLKDARNHCVNYFGFNYNGKLRLINCIANDESASIYITSTEIIVADGAANEIAYPSLTAQHTAFHLFEREISENFGIRYIDHPWLKPLRFPFAEDNDSKITDYPFYNIGSDELHEVGVGPIHAGIIEPGHFRFICKGEQILHLEIQLGYQHRGIESLFLSKSNLLQRTILAESIAGDTVVGHSSAFVNIWESLCNYSPDTETQLSRMIALELERIAIHTGDLSAICSDIAYQQGAAVFGRLRTPLINFFQSWCGNRLAKGFFRPGKNHYPFSQELGITLRKILADYQKDFEEMIDKLLHHPSSLSRLEKTGVLTLEQAISIGAVGVTAKASALARDIRASHPFYSYKQLNHKPIIKHHGDVYSRTQMRREEIRQSIGYVLKMLDEVTYSNKNSTKIDHLNKQLQSPKPNSFSISLVEGWRGEICHCAITGVSGELVHYKVKDPSFHNWMALALAVRKNEISDFPICNKSFNLSYCGFDL